MSPGPRAILGPTPLLRLSIFAVISVIFAFSRDAAAQVHWDVGAEAGIQKRVLSLTPGAADARFGPTGEIHAHVALLPLVRVGAYLGHDISPQGEGPARQITSFGARIKLNSPWPRDAWHAWFFVGFGYAAVYAPSYHGAGVVPGSAGKPDDVLVEGAGGGFFEVPVGIGLGYKLRKPLELTAELSGKVGFGSRGSLYDVERNARSQSQTPLVVDNPGNDVFGLGLLVGVSFDL